MPLRVPRQLHEELKLLASLEGMSLNQYCLFLLSRFSTHPESMATQRAENLLRFWQESHLLQKAMSEKKPKKREPLAETPQQRLKKLYENH